MIDKEQYQHMSQNELNAKLLNACFWGHLEVVQYLLTSPELKEHADIHYKNDVGMNALKVVCVWGRLDVVQYVVIDMNTKIDEDTMSWLRGNNEQKKVYQETIRLIEKRNLYYKLNKNNTNKDIKGKNFKL